MRAAIVGPPKSGRSTVFRVLTGQDRAPGRERREVGIAEIPDWRVRYLRDLYKPRKSTYARMEILVLDDGEESSFVRDVRGCDVLIEVVPAFLLSGIPGAVSAREVTSHFEQVNLSFLLKDLETVENRLERLHLNKARPVSPVEPAFLEKCKEFLEKGVPLRNASLDPVYTTLLEGFEFLTLKPFVMVLNLSEDMLKRRDFAGKDEIDRVAGEARSPTVVFCAPVEEEISRLAEEDRAEFLREYGLGEPGATRLGRTVMEHLHLISFFTVVSDEVRAWTVPAGTTALKAAGKIHSDMERGFIRAEVMAFDDLYRLGSAKAVKEQGFYRSEGKTYVVKDGDILLIRFSV